MFASERQQQILEFLRKRKSASVAELGARLYVSGATVRRDLAALARAGLISRSRGGAVLVEGAGAESPVFVRELRQTKEKRTIAGVVLPLIRPNSVLFMDSSSTVGMVVPLLSQHAGLTVITNGLSNALLLSRYTSARIYLPEGTVSPRSTSVAGGAALGCLSRFRADLALISCAGLELSAGVTEASPEQSEAKRVMLHQARTGILLCDSSKFGHTFLCRTCGLDDVRALATDRELAGENGCRLLFPARTGKI